jgi:DNA-binding transcriptional MocR family regulator
MSAKSMASSSPSATSEELPKPKDLWHHLSKGTQNRATSNIKAFYKYFAIPGIGQLAGGLPNDHYFPFDTLEARVAHPDRWTPTPNNPVEPPPELSNLSIQSESESSHLFIPKDSKAVDRLRKIDLASALQYGQAQGYPPLYKFLLDFTNMNSMTRVPYAGGPDIALTVGSTDGFSKCMQAFVNDWLEGRDKPEDKEGLLVEQFAYMSAVSTARPHGMNIAPVAIDDQGMLAYGKGALEDVLENWDFSKGKRPHLMYTVT